MNEIGERAHVLKHSHKRYVVGAFDKILNEGSIWNGTDMFYILSYTNIYFFTLYIMVKILLQIYKL